MLSNRLWFSRNIQFSDPEINVHDACADFIATSKHFEKNLYSYFNVLIILVYPEKYIPKWRVSFTLTFSSLILRANIGLIQNLKRKVFHSKLEMFTKIFIPHFLETSFSASRTKRLIWSVDGVKKMGLYMRDQQIISIQGIKKTQWIYTIRAELIKMFKN